MGDTKKTEQPVVVKTRFIDFFNYYSHTERKGEYDSAFTEDMAAFMILGYTRKGKGDRDGDGNPGADATYPSAEEMAFHQFHPESADLYVIRFRPGAMLTEVRAGRSPKVRMGKDVYLENHIIIPDPHISGSHFKLFLDRNTARLQNLNPTNKTYHRQGRKELELGPLATVSLEDDDEIRISNTIFRAKYPFALWRFMETTNHFKKPKTYNKNDRSPLELDIEELYAEMAKDDPGMQTQKIELIDDPDMNVL